jgi:hypothetical protein
VYHQTYQKYLEQMAGVDLNAIGRKLGGRIEGDDVIFSVYHDLYRVSRKGIVGPDGKRPDLDVCVILSKYILLCPDPIPPEREWTAFRDFKDTGPLTTYFSNDVEKAIVDHLDGKTGPLREMSRSMGGYAPDVDLSYDFIMQFNALPRIPVLLLYNAADEEFPAQCSVLFKKNAERFLDGECLAMLARRLVTLLSK